MDKFRAIEIFIQVAHSGSFHGATQQLGVSPQATSKAVTQLEKSLGVRLFTRNTRRIHLTDEGCQFLRDAERGMAQVNQAWSRVQEQQGDPRGLVRFTCGLHFGRVLLPLIQEFQQHYPRIEIELISTDAFTDLVEADVDFGIRNGLEPQGKLHTEKLFDIQMIACASPDYLARKGLPQSRHELVHHDCTGSRLVNSGRPEPWEFMEDGEMVYQSVPSRLWVTDSDVETDAVVRGMGIGLLANLNVAELLREGRLIPVFPNSVSNRYGVFVYYSSHRAPNYRARLLLDFLRKRLLGSQQFQLSPQELCDLHRKFADSLI